MNKTVLLIVFACAGMGASGQNISEIFAYQRDSFPTQHIYVQFDKQAYIAGDTAWFKAYIVSNNGFSSTSTNFYVDLLDERGSIVLSKKLPVFDGVASGNFDLPARMLQGVYVVRAYTKWLLNFDQGFVFKKAIPIFNQGTVSTPPGIKEEYSFEIFAEGGKFVASLPNNIAFRAMNEKMQITAVKGDLEDAKHHVAGNFADGKNGAGIFSFTPVAGEKYFAIVQFPDKTTRRYELPAVSASGVTLTVADHELGKSFSAIATPDIAKESGDLQLLAVMDNNIVLNTKIEFINNEALGVISTKDLSPGIMHILLLDRQNNLLAERTTIIQNNQLTPVELKIDTLGVSPNAKNVFSFEFPGKQDGSFSVSITDADKELVSKNDEDIFSTILLQTGANRYIPDPKASGEDALDLIIITNSWYGSDLLMLSKKKRVTTNKDLYLSVKGKVFEEENDKIINSGTLNISVQQKNLSQNKYAVPVLQGNFELDSLLFEDSARIYFEMEPVKKNKKAPPVKIMIDDIENDFSALLNADYSSYIKAKQSIFENNGTLGLASQLEKILLADAQNKIKTQNKTVTADKVPASKKDVSKRYASGIFGTSQSKTFDLINDPPSNEGTNIFDYLQGRVGGLVIQKVGGTRYNLWSNRSPSTLEVIQGNRRGSVPGKVFLNGMESSSDAVAGIHISQFALVKYYEPGSIMLPGVGISAVLAFWTKKQEDIGNGSNPDMNSVSYPGYSISRNFYSPQYTGLEKNLPDNRTTLYWNPNISLNEEKKITLVFYNSDLAKRFHVVLEGVTTDGRLIHFEKIVQ